MTLEECHHQIVLFKYIIGQYNSQGEEITALIPAPINVTHEQLNDWFSFALGFAVPPAKRQYHEFQIMGVYIRSKDDPSSAAGFWLSEEPLELWDKWKLAE